MKIEKTWTASRVPVYFVNFEQQNSNNSRNLNISTHFEPKIRYNGRFYERISAIKSSSLHLSTDIPRASAFGNMPKLEARKLPNKDGALVKIQSRNCFRMEQRNTVTHTGNLKSSRASLAFVAHVIDSVIGCFKITS
jgi:hypothetical protein